MRVSLPVFHARFRFAVALSLGLTVCSTPVVSADPPMVFSFSPTGGPPGTSVTLDGDGFTADADAHLAFVSQEAGGLGVAIDVESVDATRLVGMVGASPAAFSGRLSVWTGRLYTLPGTLYSGEAATYLVEKATYFEASSSVEAPGVFHVTAEEPGTLGGEQRQNTTVFYLDDQGDSQGILLELRVEGGDTQPPGDETSNRAVSLGLRALVADETASAALRTSDLAGVIQEVFGPLGLQAAAHGSELHLSWGQAMSRLAVLQFLEP